MAINWQSLLGLDQVRATARKWVDEGSVAIIDRVELAGLEWQSQKRALIKAVVAAVFLAYFLFGFLFLGSIIILLNWWDTPDWTTALWSVLAFWGIVSIVSVALLVRSLKNISTGFQLTRQVLAEDFQELRERL